MPRDLKAHERHKQSRARRDIALARNELRQDSTPRQSAEGATSFPVKADDPTTRAAIDAFLSRREGGL